MFEAVTRDQAAILIILVATFGLFLWGRWRHDMVAMGALLACVIAGVVPGADAFLGFGHPAVITVACVLVLSSGLQSSGAVDRLMRVVLPKSAGPVVTTAALTGLAALLSGFMNNVGALALLMPVALQVASRQQLPPGKVLMPLAFGSILGGMTTLIGTPPNLIVASFRAAATGESFAMFDFTPVGAAVALTGIVFVVLFSRWLVPTRQRSGAEGFETGAYLTEARIAAGSKAIGMTLQEIEAVLTEADAQVIGLIRDEARIPAPSPFREARQGDILVIEAEPKSLATALASLGLALEEAVSEEEAPLSDKDSAKAAKAEETEDPGGAIRSKEVLLMELVVLPRSRFVGRSASDMQLRRSFGINLLAVSRQGQRSTSRLRVMAIRAGDVLLMQGSAEALRDFAQQFDCVPLAERALRIPDAGRALTAGAIMALAVAAAASGLLPAAVAFAAGVLAFMALRVVSPRNVYSAVDWPVVVLLGALIPVAHAMASSGAAELIAGLLLQDIAQGDPVIALALILVVTMTLSDFMNNAATAAVMAPIAMTSATQLGASADPFLMAVAIGASCAFLTPIGHQNNTMILGPGGFRFGDYWRLGLPLEVIVVAVAVPLLLLVWPL